MHTLTVTDASPGTLLRVVDADGRDVVTLVADAAGNAHLAFVPEHHAVLDEPASIVDALATGDTLAAGEYRVFDDSAVPPADLGAVRVLAVDDHPDPSLYDQELAEGFGYLTVRDGVQLSVMVRFPDAGLYGPAPYPTVIEYSGYSPSDPDEPQPSTLLANLMGFAVVGVNMRGSGCSGGVFDVFSPAQAADGYDVVETVARQPWVLHGRLGMVGLSYPGISQLYVAATRPPAPRGDRADVGHRRPVAPAVARRRLQLRLHTRVAGDARPADRGRWAVLGPPTDRVRRHRRRAEPAGALPELRLRAVRTQHRELPSDARGPAARPHSWTGSRCRCT